MMLFAVPSFPDSRERASSNEQGWALLGLLLALGVMSIVLVSSVVPNVQMQVQRDKEAEMIYRGTQMAEGIARYYGRGTLQPLQVQLLLTTPYGPLTELAKLREGVTLGVKEIKFVRPSAMIDPMFSSDWEPIRARDPRVMRFLQAWLAATGTVKISQDYFLIAGPPLQRSAFEKSEPSTPIQSPGAAAPGQPTPPNPANPGNPQVKPPDQKPDDDDDDDDDEATNDPLARFFESSGPGHNSVPIVGVASKKKGTATTAYFGLDKYEDWIFIYIPRNIQQRQPNRVSQ
ncbi:MAG: hypothetical protein AABN34_17745 [Acidobacteriota bacterium]